MSTDVYTIMGLRTQILGKRYSERTTGKQPLNYDTEHILSRFRRCLKTINSCLQLVSWLQTSDSS